MAGVGWLRVVRRSLEPVIALLLLIAAWVEVAADLSPPLPMGLGLLGALAVTAPIAFSRLAPESAAVVVFIAVLLQGLPLRLPSSIAEQLAVVVTVAQAAVRVRRFRFLIAALGVGTAAVLVAREPDDVQPSDYVFTTGLLVVPFVFGLALRLRLRAASIHSERARLAVARRDELAALAVQEERARVARELHDVVAHALSVVVVQAAGGRAVLPRDPAAAEVAFATIAATGARALEELHQMLSAMDGAAEDATSGLDGLAALVRLAGAAGSPTVLAVEGRPRALLPSVELAAYRIVQEALTNAVRHAPGGATRVEVRHGERLHVRVVSEAGTAERPLLPGSGNGLLGMRERASLCGGTLTAAPTANGGFAVDALLPAAAP